MIAKAQLAGDAHAVGFGLYTVELNTLLRIVTLNPLQAIDFFKKTGCDALAISYGTCHGPNKGKDTKIRREIAIATKECMMHEGIHGFLVSHGSSTVPQE